MKKYIRFLLLCAGIAVLAGVAMFWWPEQPPDTPSTSATPVASATDPTPTAPSPSPSAPTMPAQILHPIEAITVPPTPNTEPVPPLASAERYVQQALADMLSDADIARFLQLGDFVRHLVATVDNLPREHAPALIWPINPIAGHFSTGAGDDRHPVGPTAIHPKNDVRYSAFVSFVESVDTAKAVALYVRLYPLFEQAYVELGYPSGHFNNRLVTVIDHLLATPLMVGPLMVERVDVKGPYPALRPWVSYQFVDPALAQLSAGQKMLLRSGSANQQRLLNKLRDFRALLTKAPVSPTSPSTSSQQG
ncbi:DUF3014 domain-containing protein [Rhodoferax sp. BLA1]|uniref:DUF3014 domain-containing protein n=1 Tax=Rhodoferax sp. BLA1 TaxID=2576062 RepID=UPI0015D45D1C